MVSTAERKVYGSFGRYIVPWGSGNEGIYDISRNITATIFRTRDEILTMFEANIYTEKGPERERESRFSK